MVGIPLSGKSTVAQKLKEMLESKGKRVQIINEESLSLIKNEAYKDSTSEKMTRGFLRSNVDKLLNKDDTVILDSMNYIKGYRYELNCLARNNATSMCVVFCKTELETAMKRWEAIPESANKLNKELLEDYASRMEEPKISCKIKNSWTDFILLQEIGVRMD